MRFRTFLAGTAAVVVGAALPLGAGTADAATISVPCDPAALVNAINTANATPALDTISLSRGCTYTLTGVDNTDADGPNGLPVITTPIKLAGNGATIAHDSSPTSFRLLKVDTTGNLAASNVVLQGGLLMPTPAPTSAAAGAALLNRGTVTLGKTTVRDNHVQVIAGTALPIGGAIANANGASLTINASTITGNSADTPGFVAAVAIPLGGGIANGGALSIRASTVSNNQAVGFGFLAFAVGGGISSGGNPTASLLVTGSHIVNNTVGTLGVFDAAIGGGIGANALSMSGTEVGGNQAVALGFMSGTAVGGGVATFGTTSVAKSSNIHDNFAEVAANTGRALGGGVANTADLSIVSSRLQANTAEGMNGADAFGGAVETSGSLTMMSVTVIGNTVTSDAGAALGGGVYNGPGATAHIRGGKFIANHADGPVADGGAIYNAAAPGAVTASATTFSGNTPDNCAPGGSVTGCAG